MLRPAPLLGLLTLLHVLAALIFSRGFLLTRVELPDVSSCPGPACATQQAPLYDRAVILIVDALRFDFVCENTTAEKPHAGLFPRTMQLVGDAVRGVVGSQGHWSSPHAVRFLAVVVRRPTGEAGGKGRVT